MTLGFYQTPEHFYFMYLTICLMLCFFFPSQSGRSVRFTQQLVLFAPQAISVHSHVQTLLRTLSSRQVLSIK